MNPHHESPPMSRLERGIRSWGMFVVLLEVAAGVLGVAVMSFFAFVASGQRLVPLLCLPLLVLFVRYRLRRLSALRTEAAHRQSHLAQ